ncbi:MAG TPA: hypothetical protein VE130_00100, partial [Nitrososphaeraceae archaeon]|nr:hypothetical protein [Nitrososphaeraceae archaeon]
TAEEYIPAPPGYVSLGNFGSAGRLVSILIYHGLRTNNSSGFVQSSCRKVGIKSEMSDNGADIVLML